jgi:hypothetical protein
MPQIAQQDYLLIHDPEMELETKVFPDSVKTKLKEAYAAGTIYDVVLKDGYGYTARIIGTGEDVEDETLAYITFAWEGTVQLFHV